ncbi:MAG: hypothetical protein Alpg2KO_03190 [Alphaproteobacteria bacterium]
MPNRPRIFQHRFIADKKRGVTLAEYGLLIGLISVIAIVTITQIGTEADRLFGEVSSPILQARAASNEDPTAQADSYTTDEDTAFTTGNVLANDSAPGGGTLTVTAVDTSGTMGQVTNNGDGTFGYDPNGAFEALNDGQQDTDSFSYTANDGTEDTTGTVTITILGVDEPVLAGFGSSCPSNPDPVTDIGCTSGSGTTEAYYGGEIGGGSGDPAIYIATADESSTRPWSSGILDAHAGNTQTDGEGNMASLSPGQFEAAIACAQKAPSGTWFLPARSELQSIWNSMVQPYVTAGVVSVPISNSSVPGGSDLSAKGFQFDGLHGVGRYWSSSESSSAGANAWDFDEGTSAGGVTKTLFFSVRCARR